MSLPMTCTFAGQSASEPSLIGAIADGRDVVEQGVEPDVNGLIRVERDLDPPAKALASDGDILELGFDQVDDLVAAALGLDEFRMGLVVREQAVAIRGEPEEVVLLLDPGQRRFGMVGALPPPSATSFSVLNDSQPVQ